MEGDRDREREGGGVREGGGGGKKEGERQTASCTSYDKCAQLFLDFLFL